MAVLVFNMRMERRPPRRMWQLWKIHRGVDQTTLIVSFEDDSHFFNLRRYFFTHGRPSSYFVSDARCDQGRKERPNCTIGSIARLPRIDSLTARNTSPGSPRSTLPHQPACVDSAG